jgi:P2 family phage contractile tail tube protein
MQINKVLNANVYLDGTNSQIGRASEITLPDVAAKIIEHTGLGMIGTLEIPTGLEKLELKIKWSGFYADLVKLKMNPFAAHKFQVRANVETYGPGGRVSETPLKVFLTASWKKAPMGGLKPMEASEQEDELSCTYMKVTLGTEDLVEIDVLQNVWKAGGVDVLANFRQNVAG